MNDKIKNLNDCQKQYRAMIKKNAGLVKKIERALLDQPAAAEGNWGMVGDMQHVNELLQSVSDFICNEGEYA